MESIVPPKSPPPKAAPGSDRVLVCAIGGGMDFLVAYHIASLFADSGYDMYASELRRPPPAFSRLTIVSEEMSRLQISSRAKIRLDVRALAPLTVELTVCS